MDPTLSEEQRESALATVVCESKTLDLISIEAAGPMAQADVDLCIKAAGQVSGSLLGVYRRLVSD